MEEECCTGYVKVFATTARGSYPVKNATVTVLIEGEEAYKTSTDDSGNTEKLPLKTQPAENSRKPGEEQPYTVYDVRIDALGFMPLVVRGVPVFEDQTSVVRVSLIPEFASGGRNDPIIRDNRPDFRL